MTVLILPDSLQGGYNEFRKRQLVQNIPRRKVPFSTVLVGKQNTRLTYTETMV